MVCAKLTIHAYCIAGKFGNVFDLAIWWSRKIYLVLG